MFRVIRDEPWEPSATMERRFRDLADANNYVDAVSIEESTRELIDGCVKHTFADGSAIFVERE